MKDYKSGSHTVWDCKYHLVWTTKYRYQVLSGDVTLRCRELLREIAQNKRDSDLRRLDVKSACCASLIFASPRPVVAGSRLGFRHDFSRCPNDLHAGARDVLPKLVNDRFFSLEQFAAGKGSVTEWRKRPSDLLKI